MRSKTTSDRHTWTIGTVLFHAHHSTLQLRYDHCSTCGCTRTVLKHSHLLTWRVAGYALRGSPSISVPDCEQKAGEKVEAEAMVHKWKLIGNIVRNPTTKKIEWWEACQIPGCTCKRLMKNNKQVQYYELNGVRIESTERPVCGGYIKNRNSKKNRKDLPV